MDILPILQYILWLIIRVAILILAWILFAINLVLIIILFVIITGFVLILNIFVNLNLELSFNKVSVSGEIDLLFEYYIDVEYIEFFDLHLPIIKTYINTSDYELEYFAGFLSMKFSITRFPENIIEDLKSSGPDTSSLDLPKSSDEHTSNNDPNQNDYDFWTGFGNSIAFLSSIVGLLLIQNENYQYFFAIGSLIIFGVSMGLIIANFVSNPEDISSSLLMGMGLGFLLSGGLFLISGAFIKKNWNFMAKFIKFFGNEMTYLKLGVLDLFFSFLTSTMDLNDFFKKFFNIEGSQGYFIENKKFEQAAISVFTGIFSLILAQQALVFLGGRYEYIGSFYPNGRAKSRICFIFGGIGIAAGIICLIMAGLINDS